MKLYVVHRARPGYAHEDVGTSDVIGVYTRKEIAQKVAALGYGRWDEVDVDVIPGGIKAAAPHYGIDLEGLWR